MRALEPLVFHGITPQRMDLIRFRAKSQSLPMAGSHGLETWDHGIGVDWVYDENKETLTFKASVPFGVSDAEVEGHISALVRQTAPGYPQDEAHGLSAKEAVEARQNLDAHGKLDEYNSRQGSEFALDEFGNRVRPVVHDEPVRAGFDQGRPGPFPATTPGAAAPSQVKPVEPSAAERNKNLVSA